MRQETSKEIVSWLESVRLYAPIWTHVDDPIIDPSVRFFDVDILRKKNHVVVPFFNIWACQSKPSFEKLRAQGFGRFYVTGFDEDINDDKFFSCAPDHAQMRSSMLEFIDLCIVTPRGEDFIILQSYYDYWLLAGEPNLITSLLGQPLELAFREFSDDVFNSPDSFEAGSVFAEDIIEKYKKHNHRILNQ